jgi:dienelactone hydrolase
MSLRLLVLLVVEVAIAATASAQERVTVPGRDGVALNATLYRPVGTGPFAAIVAMHGCGGAWKARDDDWSERLQSAGYLVLFPDSFGSRGMGPQCNVRKRVMSSKDRAEDAFAAAEWLASRPDVVKDKIGLLGWSNGGTAALSASRSIRAPVGVEFRQAIAFYPGCRVFSEQSYRARIPVTILHGLADDWTPAEPCKSLSGVTFVGYPETYHDFDHPNLAVKTRKAAFSANGSGIVTVGTNPEAREQAIARTMSLFSRM